MFALDSFATSRILGAVGLFCFVFFKIQSSFHFVGWGHFSQRRETNSDVLPFNEDSSYFRSRILLLHIVKIYLRTEETRTGSPEAQL